MSARIDDCGEPGCTGVHRTGGGYSNLCPRTKRRNRELEKSRRDKDHCEPYLYAILINGNLLKIGYSSRTIKRQMKTTSDIHRGRMKGKASVYELAWTYRPGSLRLESFLHWCAAGHWLSLDDQRPHTKTSEWFYTGGEVSPDEIRAYLDWWVDLSKSVDQRLGERLVAVHPAAGTLGGVGFRYSPEAVSGEARDLGGA